MLIPLFVWNPKNIGGNCISNMSLVTIHRVNSIDRLHGLDARYGVEIDIRHNTKTGRLYLNHDPGTGDDFEKYIKMAATKKCPLVILNIKEAGIERAVIDIVRKYKIKDWFLLDVEFPFIYKAAHGGVPHLHGRVAVRYSEAEPIEQALRFAGKFRWVWVDVNSRLPLNKRIVQKLKNAGYKLALVCPERWGRPQDIPKYVAHMKQNGITIDTVMTAERHATKWEQSGVLILV